MSYVKRDKFSSKDVPHGGFCVEMVSPSKSDRDVLTGLYHKLLSQTQSSVRPHDTDTCDMAVGNSISRFFFPVMERSETFYQEDIDIHLRKDIPNDTTTLVLRNVRQLWPGQSMVEV